MSEANNGIEGSGGSPKKPGFRLEYFEEFVSILGAARAVEWVDRLDLLLASVFADDKEDPNALRMVAHTMVSQAGTLGFEELSQRCSTLEQAILAGGPHHDALAAVRREAQRVAGDLSRLRTDLSQRR